MDKDYIDNKILTLKEKLEMMLMLDSYMRKDPVYQARCSPTCDGAVEATWNTVQIYITQLERKIEYYESLFHACT